MSINSEVSNLLSNPEKETFSREKAVALFGKMNKSGVDNSQIQDVILDITHNHIRSSKLDILFDKQDELFQWFLEYTEETDRDTIRTKKQKLMSGIGVTAILFTFSALFVERLVAIDPSLRSQYQILNHIGNADNMILSSISLYSLFLATVGIGESKLIKKDALKYEKIIDLCSQFMDSIVPILVISFTFLLGLDVETLQLTPLPSKIMGTPNILDIPVGLVGIIAGAQLLESFRTVYSAAMSYIKEKVETKPIEKSIT